jgi:hypothetical protein
MYQGAFRMDRESLMGSECIFHSFRKFSTIWRWVASLTPRPLYPPWNSPRHPLDMRLDGFHNRCGRYGDEKNLFPFLGIAPRFLGRPISSLSLVIHSFIHHWLYSPLLDPGRSFLSSFVILYTVGRTPWTGDQPVARPLPTHRTAQTQNKRT